MLFSLFVIKLVFGLRFSKSTTICTKDVVDSAFDFMMSYLPVQEVQTDCIDRVCTCGNQALVTLTNSSDADSFELGCVFAPGENRARWLQSGYLHVEALELILSNKLGDMSVYDIFMEYSIGLYTNDITKFVEKLESDGVEYLSLSWDQYVSVLVHPPSSQLVFEIIAEAERSPDWLLEKAVLLTSPRFDFGEQSFPTLDMNGYYMHPLWISNLATNVSGVREYFISLFDHLSPEFKVSTGVDAVGASYEKLQIKFFLAGQDSPTQLRFIEPDKKSEGQFSVAWWEGYLNDVHDEFMYTPTCGWDILGDAHFTLSSWSPENLDEILGRAEEFQYRHFCQKLDNSTVDCFFNSPFGVQIELKGTSLRANTYYSYEQAQQCATYNEWCDSEHVAAQALNNDHKNIGFAEEEAEESAFSAGSTSDALWCTVGIAVAILGHIRIKPQREEKRTTRQKTFLASIRGHCNTPGKRTLTLGGKVHPDLTPVKDPDVITDNGNVLV